MEGVTPAIFAETPSGEMVAMGDLSPNAGEALAGWSVYAASSATE